MVVTLTYLMAKIGQIRQIFTSSALSYSVFAVVRLKIKIVEPKTQSEESNFSSPSQFVNSQSGAAQPWQMVQSRMQHKEELTHWGSIVQRHT